MRECDDVRLFVVSEEGYRDEECTGLLETFSDTDADMDVATPSPRRVSTRLIV